MLFSSPLFLKIVLSFVTFSPTMSLSFVASPKEFFCDFFENNTVQKNKKMKTLNPNKKMEEHKTHYE